MSCRLLSRIARLLLFTVLPLAQGQTNYQRLRSFGFAERMGASPRTAPIEASDGRVYGTTFLTGGDLETDGGGIFRMNKDGSSYRLIHRFRGNHEDAANLPGSLVEGADGALYGVTAFGGSNDLGTVFKLNKDGSGMTVLHSFSGTNGDGSLAEGRVTEGSDGTLYGITGLGGSNNCGVVFKLNPDGSDYEVLYSFACGADGCWPIGHIVEGSDGLLYGSTLCGVFRLSKDGADFMVLHRFSGSDGLDALDVIEASDGFLYGVTSDGGQFAAGVIFRIGKDGSEFSVLHSFADHPGDAEDLFAGLVEGSDGALYGASYEGGTNDMGAIFRISKDGSSYWVLRSFDEEDGDCPYAGLSPASDGTLLGATNDGGNGDAGTIFKISKDGSQYRVLHDFSLIRPGNGVAGSDGITPQGGLIQATDGAFYGTTTFGGNYGWGTLFKFNQDGGGYAVLLNFAGTGSGANPQARLLEGSDGELYGTTSSGSTNGGGLAFKVGKNGAGFTPLRAFTGHGSNQLGALLEGSGGVLYGSAGFDGTNQAGVIFRLSKDGSDYSALHRFTGVGGDGATPVGDLIKGTDGLLYGATFAGGTFNNGTVFAIDENGSAYKILYRFESNGAGGRRPTMGLVEGSDGALYGTTASGGSNDFGTVFKLSKNDGTLVVLHSFSNDLSDAAQPSGALVEGKNGTLFGLTSRGGSFGSGTAFKVNKDGSGFAVLRSFADSGGDGEAPFGALILGKDAFYGTATEGGAFSSGIIFRLFSGIPRVTINSIEVDLNGVLLELSGAAAGERYEIEANSVVGDGSAWSPLGAASAEIDGHFEFSDPDASNHAVRFYRGVRR